MLCAAQAAGCSSKANQEKVDTANLERWWIELGLSWSGSERRRAAEPFRRGRAAPVKGTAPVCRTALTLFLSTVSTVFIGPST